MTFDDWALALSGAMTIDEVQRIEAHARHLRKVYEYIEMDVDGALQRRAAEQAGMLSRVRTKAQVRRAQLKTEATQ